jgi:hypothetical protein
MAPQLLAFVITPTMGTIATLFGTDGKGISENKPDDTDASATSNWLALLSNTR